MAEQKQQQQERAVVVGNLANLRGLLEKSHASFGAIATKYLTPERLTKVALVAASRVPRLLECTQRSILESLMTAGQVGLEPNSPLGHCYLVPYFNSQIGAYECQLQLGYRGLEELARRSEVIASMQSGIVHAKDIFEFENGVNPRFRHVPHLGYKRAADGTFAFDQDGNLIAEESGPVVAGWAMARFKDEHSDPQVEIMTIAELERIRKRSKTTKQDTPWNTDTDEMRRKTVEKRLCKRLPLTIEIAEAIDRDNQVEFDLEALPEPEQRPDPKPASQLLKDIEAAERGAGNTGSTPVDAAGASRAHLEGGKAAPDPSASNFPPPQTAGGSEAQATTTARAEGTASGATQAEKDETGNINPQLASDPLSPAQQGYLVTLTGRARLSPKAVDAICKRYGVAQITAVNFGQFQEINQTLTERAAAGAGEKRFG